MPGKMACVSLHARLAARLAVRLFESCDREGCRLFDALPMSSLPGVIQVVYALCHKET